MNPLPEDIEIIGEQDSGSLAVLLRMTSDGIVIADIKQRIVFFNEGSERIFGYSSHDVLGQDISTLLPERNRIRHRELVTGFQGSPIPTRMMSERKEISGLRADGVEFPAEISISRILFKGKMHLAAIIRDISRRKALEHQLKEKIRDLEKSERESRYRALHDPLTKLPNRSYFKTQLEKTILLARDDSGAALLFLDLDNFKEVNDRLGHAVGDELLRQVADRLKSGIRTRDTLSRIGGDEFTVILPGVGQPEAAAAAQRLRNVMQTPFNIEGRPLSVSASIGIAMCPADSADVDGLLRSADVAMYRVKKRKNHSVAFFQENSNGPA